VLGKVGQAKFRRSGVTGNLSVNDSARLRLPARVNTGNVAEVRRLDFVNRQFRQVAEDLRTKRGISERECRALTLNSRHHNEPERPQESSTARHRDNRKVGRENPKKEHRRQGHNSSDLFTAAARERIVKAFVVGRLCQTPIHDLFIIGKTFLIWPLFPVFDQTSSNRILSNVVPLFVC
jgi:hypothetical protein